MLRNLITRRRTERERVDAFLAAIHATTPAPVRPLPLRMGTVPSPRTDTAALPRIVATASATLAAAVILTGCAGGTTPAAAPVSSPSSHTVQLELPAVPSADPVALDIAPTRPRDYPHLTDEWIAELAAERRATRAATLTRLTGGPDA